MKSVSKFLFQQGFMGRSGLSRVPFINRYCRMVMIKQNTITGGMLPLSKTEKKYKGIYCKSGAKKVSMLEQKFRQALGFCTTNPKVHCYRQ